MKLSLLNRLRKLLCGTQFVFIRNHYGFWQEKEVQLAPDGQRFVVFQDYPEHVAMYLASDGTGYRIFQGDELPQPKILWRQA